jgi:hypothetical protein
MKMHVALAAAFSALGSHAALAASEGGDTWSELQPQPYARSTQSPAVATIAPLSSLQHEASTANGTPAQAYSADRTVPVVGGALTTIASVNSSAGYAARSIESLNADSTNIYWIDSANAAVDSVPTGGGSVTSLATGLSSPTSLQIGAGMAFWTEAGAFQGCCRQMGSGSIRQVPLVGGTASTVVGNLDAPTALAVDASTNIVWAELWRVAKAATGGTTVTLASGISSDLPRIAADQAGLYVLDGDLINKDDAVGRRGA